MTSPAIDLLSTTSFHGQQPHDMFDWLRVNEPVHRHEEPDGPGFWVVTRYEDVRSIGRDPRAFSSEPTIMIEDPRQDQSAALGDHKMMLMVDPPVHTRMRRLVSRDFTPKAAQELRSRVGELATRIVDEVAGRGSCDLVADLVGEMPSFVIADILGIALEEGRELYRHTEALHSSREAVAEGARAHAFNEMFATSQRVWAEKREEPGDDLATMLAHADIDGVPLDAIDFFLWFMLLVDAGGDTTRNLVGGAMHSLLADAAQMKLLNDAAQLAAGGDGAALSVAVEELLRWVTPVIYMRRTATRDLELHGVRIAAGDKVVVYYGAANRDPAVFDDPHRLDLTSNPNPHVAFGGGGPHFCLGAHLARVEIEALLVEMMTRLSNLEASGEPEWMASNFIYGPTTLPVTFDA